MALTKDELATIDNQTNTKKEFQEALHEHADAYPALLDITTDDKRDKMRARAEEIIDGEVTSEAKTEAVRRMNETSDVVVALRRQGFLSLSNGKETFTLRMFERMGSKHRTERKSTLQYEEHEPPENRINVTPLSEIPEWAYENIYDLAVDGTLKIYDSEDHAQQESRDTIQKQKPILADPTQSPSMIVEQQDGRGGADATLVDVRPGLKNASPEQDAAWHVLNSEVNGIPPIPTEPEERSDDYNNLTETELNLVTERVKKGLEQPKVFTTKLKNKDFDDRKYLSQLLKLELTGKTAPRRGTDRNISNVTRREVVKIIRGIAQELGYTVTGHFVREDPDRAVGAQLEEDPDWVPAKGRYSSGYGEAMPGRG